jgi:hypothetical protein
MIRILYKNLIFFVLEVKLGKGNIKIVQAGIKNSRIFKEIACSALYSRLRSRLPSKLPTIYDDRDGIDRG